MKHVGFSPAPPGRRPFPAVAVDAPQSRHAVRRASPAVFLATAALAAGAGWGEEPAPVSPGDAAVTPQEISIGEPISLPYAPPRTAPPPTAADAGTLVAPPASVLAPAGRQAAAAGAGGIDATAAGSGWLGFAVDDSLVAGRLVVVEVTPGGPTARAGIKPQDMLLALDGTALHTSDELAAALAAIAPGQRVNMAIGRDSRIEEVAAIATTRPAAAQNREWSPAEPPSPSAAATAAPPLPRSSPATTVPSLEIAPAAAVPLPRPSRVPAVMDAVPLDAATAAGGTRRSAAQGRTALGVRTVPLGPAEQSRFHLAGQDGALVIGVVQDLPASRAGVPPGSVIVAINHQPVRSPQELTQLVTAGPIGTPVPLRYVLPGGIEKQAEVLLQALELPMERALVGGDVSAPLQALAPPDLQLARRMQPAGARGAESGGEAFGRVEDLVRRLNARIEQLEYRLDRIDSRR